MIVRFRNTFHVPGFGRKRFRKGVVLDVPESLRDRLPTSAVILNDDYKTSDASNALDQDERKAADYVRAAAEGTSQEALEKAGMAGFVDEEQEQSVKGKTISLKKK